VAHLRELGAAGVRPLIGAYSEGTAERLRQVLADHGFDALTQVSTWAEAAKAPTATVAVLPLDRGFVAPGIHVLGEHDLLGDRLTSTTARKRARRADKFLQDLTALSPGDLVVHAEHGIARFEGLETLQVGGRRTTASSSSTPATTSCSCRSRGWRSCRATATRRPRRSSTSWAGRAGRAGRRRSSSASASWPRS
jgi:hypothetical protein